MRSVRTIAQLLVAAAFVAPLAWMLLASTKTAEQVAAGGLFPAGYAPQLGNYAEVFERMPFAQQSWNTLRISLLNVVGSVLTGALTGYAFARLRFCGRDLLFLLVLSAMLLPPQVTMIPQFLLFKQLGWLDSALPLTVPAFFAGNGFNAYFIFLFRQFYLTLPRELEEAARVDGASFFGAFLRIFLPLSLPAAAAVAVFAFVWTWNDFQLPLIFLHSPEHQTLALGLAAFKGGPFSQTHVHVLMAASVLVVAPCALLFLVAQGLFTRSLSVGGLKA